MITTETLFRCVQKLNPGMRLLAKQGKWTDRVPATLCLGRKELLGIPKGWIYEFSSWKNDGSIEHRGWRDIVKRLVEWRLVDKRKLINLIKRAEGGMVI